MEALKYDWIQAVAASVSERLPVFGAELLQKYYPHPRSLN
jgi:hypothetical protein